MKKSRFRLVVLLGIFLLMNVTIPLSYAATVTFNDFSDLSEFTLNGSAATIGNPVLFNGRQVLRLTDTYWQAGSAFLTNPITLDSDGSFSTFFRFQITNSAGFQGGADGLVFVVQSMANDALGTVGGGLGYAGISPSLGIEFDTYDNPPDPDGNHIAINLDGSVNSVSHYNVPTSMNNGNVWHAWVDHNGATALLEVRLSETSLRPGDAQLSCTLDLPSILGTSNVFVGFTSATGEDTGDHDILSWQFIDTYNPVPIPGAIWLLGSGLIGLAGIRKKLKK